MLPARRRLFVMFAVLLIYRLKIMLMVTEMTMAIVAPKEAVLKAAVLKDIAIGQ